MEEDSKSRSDNQVERSLIRRKRIGLNYVLTKKQAIQKPIGQFKYQSPSYTKTETI